MIVDFELKDGCICNGIDISDFGELYLRPAFDVLGLKETESFELEVEVLDDMITLTRKVFIDDLNDPNWNSGFNDITEYCVIYNKDHEKLRAYFKVYVSFIIYEEMFVSLIVKALKTNVVAQG